MNRTSSMFRFMRPRNILGFSFLTVTLTLLSLASGVDPTTSLLFVVSVYVQFFIGRTARQIFNVGYREDTLADLAISSGLGSVLSGITHVSLVDTRLSSVAWALPLLVLYPITFVRRPSVQIEPRSGTLRTDSIAGVCAVLLVVLGATYGWQFFFGVAVFLFVLLWEQSKRRRENLSQSIRKMLILGSLSAIALLVGLVQFSQKSRFWWMVNSDISFTEVNAQSLAYSGFSNHLALLGESPLGRYHWFPFAWSGSMHRFIDAQPWWVTTRLAHVVWVGLLCMVIWSLVERNSKLPASANVLISAVSALVAGSVGYNYTAMFGVAFVALIIYTYLIKQRDSSQSDVILCYVVLSTGLVLSKPQLSLPLIGGIVLTYFCTLLKSGLRIRSNLLFIVALVFPIPLAFFSQTVLVGSHISSGGALAVELVSVGSFGELGNARNLFAIPLAALVVIGWILPLVATLIISWRNKVSNDVLIPLSVISAVALAALFMTDAPFHTLGGYLSALVGCVTGIAIAWTLPNVWLVLRGNGKLIVAAFAVLISSVAGIAYWPKLLNDEPTGSVINMSIRTLKGAQWIPILLVCAVAFLVMKGIDKERIHRLATLFGPLLLISGIYSVLNVTDLYQTVIKNKTVDESVVTGLNVFDYEIAEVRNIIQKETKTRPIIGSNVFCSYGSSELCKDPNWWETYVEEFEEVYASSRCIELPYHFVDWSLAAELGQFLIQGPQMFQGLYSWCQVPPEWLSERVEKSESFGRNPNSDSFSFLCENDVNWFIADRSHTDRTSWQPYGSIRLKNDNLILIELDDFRCKGESKGVLGSEIR